LGGILLIDKPVGLTSHDVVDYIRKLYMLKKVGHGGTLDPLASGLLIIMLGRATKLSQKIIALDKEYIAEMTLGFSTTTGDLGGQVVEKAKDDGYLKLAKYQIEQVFQKFLGEIEQIPPMYSAVKYKGVRLYKLARKDCKTDFRIQYFNWIRMHCNYHTRCIKVLTDFKKFLKHSSMAVMEAIKDTYADTDFRETPFRNVISFNHHHFPTISHHINFLAISRGIIYFSESGSFNILSNL